MPTSATAQLVPLPGRARAVAPRWLPALLLLPCAACSGGGESEDSVGFLRPAAADGGAVLAKETPPPAAPPVQEPEASPPAGPAAPSAPLAAPVEASAASSPPVHRTAEAEDLELASSLLHQPTEAFAALVDRHAAALGTERKRLLLAFSAARTGDLAEVRRLSQGLEASSALSESEKSLLRGALEPAAARAAGVALAVSTPLDRAMELCLLEREARSHAAAGAHALSAAAWSRLLLAEIASPWEADRESLARWTEALEAEQRQHRWNPRGSWPSIEVQVEAGDSLIAIRKRILEQRPELLLCTGLIARANGLPSETAIRPGDVLRIPIDRPSALVDVAARWTLYLLGDEVAAAWEVGVGREEGSTRPGLYTIGDKQVEPMWFQAGRKPVPFGDPENPLGTRWLSWREGEAETHLGFHGTSDPGGVGGRVSQGCVRMRNADIERFYEILPKGALVRVQL